MIDALVLKVWSNPHLKAALVNLEKAWIARSAGIDPPPISIEPERAMRCVEAAAILACSDKADQRLAAYRLATYVHELFGGSLVGLESSVRAVLTRLGNFPSLNTNAAVNSSLVNTPWSIVEEEYLRRKANEVSVTKNTLTLTDFQKILWDGLSAGCSIAISAPTSTGKSFVLQAFISNGYASRSSFCACYIVPTRALISQVQADLSIALIDAGVRQVEVVTVPPEPDETLPGKVVFVLTQERLQILLNNDPARMIDFLVIDEAHSVQDGDRGVILQTTIDEVVARNPTVQMLFASPTVSNLKIFGEMTGRSDVLERSTDDITVSQNFIEVEVVQASRGQVVLYAREGADRREVGRVQLGQTLASRVDCLVHLSHRFGGDKQSIIFSDGQADAEKLALQIADLRSIESDTAPIAALKELSELAKEAVHPKYALATTVLHGVGFHYGNIPTIVRNAVEKAFAEGHLRDLVCTSTLLAGVNLPAQNIFIHTPHRQKTYP